jgi:hypothetical protein
MNGMRAVIVTLVIGICFTMVYSQSIEVVSPQSGDVLEMRSSVQVKWKNSRPMMKGQGSGGVEVILFQNRVRKGTVYKSSVNLRKRFNWTVGQLRSGRVGAGKGYWLQIHVGGVKAVGRSGKFIITAPKPAEHDLEVVNIANSAGKLFAIVKNNSADYRGNLEFSAVYPLTRMTVRDVNLRRGREVSVDLGAIPVPIMVGERKCNNDYTVTVNWDRSIVETDYSNNSFEKTLPFYDRYFRISILYRGQQIRGYLHNDRMTWDTSNVITLQNNHGHMNFIISNCGNVAFNGPAYCTQTYPGGGDPHRLGPLDGHTFNLEPGRGDDEGLTLRRNTNSTVTIRLSGGGGYSGSLTFNIRR